MGSGGEWIEGSFRLLAGSSFLVSRSEDSSWELVLAVSFLTFGLDPGVVDGEMGLEST